MIRSTCDICRGAGTVRLPIFRPLNLSPCLTPEDVCEASYRNYACPECSDVTPVARVHALHTEVFAASHIPGGPDFIDHVQRGLAHQLAGHLLEHDYIEFKRGPEDVREMRWQMVATVGVVPKSKLSDLEARIAARQTEIANEAVAEAQSQVSNWGSHYGHAEILKRDAIRLIGESIRRALDKRAAFKVIQRSFKVIQKSREGDAS
jgi:hypothetical protein